MAKGVSIVNGPGSCIVSHGGSDVRMRQTAPVAGVGKRKSRGVVAYNFAVHCCRRLPYASKTCLIARRYGPKERNLHSVRVVTAIST